ncbi:MAG: hypothetical protein JO147_05620 [Actinobacteria bacterium]|nr:hypothetical protein [Actinomycetota bacterium]
MSAANQVDTFVGWSGQTARLGEDWAGKHRGVGRALLSFHRMFYKARHRRG